MNWLPIEEAPKDERILLRYTSRNLDEYAMGAWNPDTFGKPPRPYWTNDLSHVRGKLHTRNHQPTHFLRPKELA